MKAPPRKQFSVRNIDKRKSKLTQESSMSLDTELKKDEQLEVVEFV